jgi:hypothetical protein
LEGRKNELIKIITFIVLLILSVSLLIIIIFHFIGDFIFSLVFGVDILPYMFLLTPSIITSTILTMVMFFISVLIALHKRVQMLICLLFGAIILSVIVTPATVNYNIIGTINVFSFSLLLIVIIQIIFTLKYIVFSKNKLINI